MKKNSFETITELPNTEITEIQLKRSFQRYYFAKKLSGNGKIVEIGCGGGQGLNLFLEASNIIIGYDINEINVGICNETYKNESRINFFQQDAEELIFKKNSINTFLIFETNYYLKNQEAFFKKLYEALERDGKIIVCSANKDWHSFNPSPFSTKYLSLNDLIRFLTNTNNL